MVFKKKKPKAAALENSSNSVDNKGQASVFINKKRRMPKISKRFAVIGVIGLLAILALGGAYGFVQYRNYLDRQQQEITALVNQGRLLATEGQATEAASLFDQAIAKASSNEQKAELNLQKADICYVNRDIDGCVLPALDEYDRLVGADYRSKILRAFIVMSKGRVGESNQLYQSALDELKQIQNPSPEQKERLQYVEGMIRSDETPR